MAKIRILPDKVANQIAAGEVVERPAAVIKELLENSLDSGATRIEVEFRNGGKSYMRVEDNGSGMTPDDALMSIERHATSKIREAKDLSSVMSFGFRGEALPSIASVSRFSIKTQVEGQAAGSELLIDGGKLIYQKECGMPVGTQVVVANLYNSVPARRKFMKTENTEAAHIIHCVKLFAIANPSVGFTLLDNGRTLFKSSPSKDLKERVGNVWSKKLVSNLVDLDAQEGSMRIKGLLSEPGVCRSTRQEMITFVNGRPVDCKTLSYSLIDAYHGHIPKARYPIAFLFLEINPELVDVNVHPAKREIKFRQEGLVRQFVIRAVMDRLKSLTQEETFGSFKRDFVKPSVNTIATPEVSKVMPVPVFKAKPHFSAPKPVFQDSSTTDFNQSKSVVEAVNRESNKSIQQSKKKSNWRFLAYLQGDYVLFEADSGMVVMNYKGALERVRYEEIWKSFKTEKQETSQPLLFPIPLELEPLESAALAEGMNILNKGGFKIELFGRNFYRIEAVPAWLEPGEAESFVRDIAGLVREQGGIPKNRDLFYENMAKMASSRGIKTERPNEVKVLDLADRLMSCDNSMTCPRGYPTYYETGYSELGRKFGR